MTSVTRRRGTSLLEVLVAIVILAVAGVGLITLLGQTGNSLHDALDRDALTRLAATRLEAESLRSPAELQALVGERSAGPLRLHVQQLAGDLFVITATDTLDDAVVLRTTLYRPEVPRDTTR